MTDKINGYDVLGVLVPGTLVLGWGAVCFDFSGVSTAAAQFPEAFSVVLLTALAVFLGQLLQAIASQVEPILYRTWRGRPSDAALTQGLKGYLPKESANRIREKLRASLGNCADEHSLFLYAMQLSEGQDSGRVCRFNSLYAYHRGLLVLVVASLIALIASVFWGYAAAWTIAARMVAIAVAVFLVLVFWNRAWQRACYYVREVLLSAERILDERSQKKE